MSSAPASMAGHAPDEYIERLRQAPMSRFQVLAIAVTFALCALDGFDVFAIAFAAPAIASEWGISKAALGIVFSAGLAGMALGSLLFAPLADIFGRRRLVIASLLLMASGTWWTVISHEVVSLGLSRLLTGFGVGAMIAVINPLAAEYSNARHRDLSVTLLNLGFPLGAVLGGALAAYLMPIWGWRSVFEAATIITVLMLLVVLRYLPEPPASLIARQAPGSLARVNSYLERCGQPALLQLPEKRVRSSSFALILQGDDLRRTLRVIAIYFLFIMSVFFIQSWLTSIVAAAGYSPSSAAMVSVFLNLGGIAGGLLLGFTSPRLGLKRLVIAAFAGTAISITLFGAITPTFSLLSAMAVLIGVCTIGGMTGFYAVISRSFPAEARASGTGLVVGLGRIGSAISPAMAGGLYSFGFRNLAVCAALAVPALLAALLLIGHRPHPTSTD